MKNILRTLSFKLIFFIWKNLELFFWLIGLTYLLIINPWESHFSICPLKKSGIDWCPGCGLGKSISLIFHFDFLASLNAHPLGSIALLLIIQRIIQLLKNIRNTNNGEHLQLSS